MKDYKFTLLKINNFFFEIFAVETKLINWLKSFL